MTRRDRPPPPRAHLPILLFALLLASCAKAASDLANAMVAPHIGTPYHVAEPPTRERMLDMPNYQDCNHNALDGRETDVKTSDAHCGACDHACDAGHCERGACTTTP